MSHTPGPWKYNEAGAMVLANNDQINIADIRGFGFLSTCKTEIDVIATMDANGRLIAAAPDLLKALRDIADHQLIVGGSMAKMSATYQIAVNAIAKVQG